jgi:hypothetical protein
LALAWLSCAACQSKPEEQLVTQVQALTPAAPLAPVTTAPAPCAEAERQARELGASLPRQLDEDTRATRVSAQGCHLTLEYELSTLEASEVAPGGVNAMREQLAEQLCEDRGALAVFNRGGTFTHVYYDRVHAPIGRFTVEARDCERAR